MINNQIPLFFLPGLLLALFAFYLDSKISVGRLVGLLKIVLLLKITLFTLMTIALFLRSHWLALSVLHVKMRYSFDLLYAGCFTGYVLTAILFYDKVVRQLKNSSIGKSSFFKVVRLSVASTFLFSSIAAMVFFDKSLSFFLSCGYNKGFMIIIIVVEFLCSLMLLIENLAPWAAIILMLDMTGAIYTHYHNYFSRNIPGPFDNSIPAAVTLVLLMTIVILSRGLITKQL